MATQQTSFIDLPSLYAFGLGVYVSNNIEINVNPGQARSQFNEFDIVLTPFTTIDITKKGVNGLDTGVVTANTWYAVYVIYDSTLALPTETILSCQQLTLSNSYAPPVLPFGYSHYRRIAYVQTDSSSNLIPFNVGYNTEFGNNCYRYYQWNTPIQVLISGTSTSFSSVNLGSALPYNERGSANLGILFTNSITSSTASIRPTGTSTGIGSCPINVNSTVSVSVTSPQFPSCWLAPQNMVSGFPSLDYAVTGGSLSIWVNGYYDCI